GGLDGGRGTGCCASNRPDASITVDKRTRWARRLVIGAFAILVSCEAVKESLAVGFGQIRLCAAARAVRRVPRTVAAAVAVGKTDLGVGPSIGRIQVAAGLSGIRAFVACPFL